MVLNERGDHLTIDFDLLGVPYAARGASVRDQHGKIRAHATLAAPSGEYITAVHYPDGKVDRSRASRVEIANLLAGPTGGWIKVEVGSRSYLVELVRPAQSINWRYANGRLRYEKGKEKGRYPEIRVSGHGDLLGPTPPKNWGPAFQIERIVEKHSPEALERLLASS